ncbi:hypothetical protein EK21DRAFT_73593 [Setomelanomma holmii]|uniref:Uncharacterized protein n=1 Tax=Setomelanomma holmii TaxID=210430 RepID=A0A9P4LIL0_9PLEO|nr:hypothetical protein EK21DRAFT_73593 [Setomelanomma holmii]
MDHHEEGVREVPVSSEDCRYHESIPEAVIEETAEGLYRVCWQAKVAGVVTTEPCLLRKEVVANRHPHILEAWESKQRNEREQARQIEQKIVAFARKFLDTEPPKPGTLRPRPSVACDQGLLPGMARHWGELHRCVVHPEGHPVIYVCKGCRIAHHALDSRAFDPHLIMARGARVPVCGKCAAMAVESSESEHQGCVCDSYRACFRCREAELEKLAAARKNHVDGRCGQCGKDGDLVRHVDVCLHCKLLRIYAAVG